jgi:hypothetical protein
MLWHMTTANSSIFGWKLLSFGTVLTLVLEPHFLYLMFVNPDVDGRIILRWMFRKLGVGCGDCIESAQDRDRWRALVSTVKNLRVP